MKKKAIILFIDNYPSGRDIDKIKRQMQAYELSQQLNLPTFIYFTHFPDYTFAGIQNRLKIQEGTSFHKKLEHAFKNLFFLGYDQALFIDSRYADMTVEDVKLAFNSLDAYKVVIGATDTEKIYLFGLAHFFGQLFKESMHANPVVSILQATGQLGVKYHLLKELTEPQNTVRLTDKDDQEAKSVNFK